METTFVKHPIGVRNFESLRRELQQPAAPCRRLEDCGMRPHQSAEGYATMKNGYTILYILSLLLLTACGGRYEGMRLQLDSLQALNQADSLLTDDSLALALAHYFDRHGTANDRMEAHYLLGRTYADRGEAPRAIDEYHAAADCAHISIWSAELLSKL